jgi:hypothetical protein
LVGLSVGLLAGQSVRQLIDWTVCQSVCRSVCRSVSWSIGSVGWSVGWSVSWCGGALVVVLVGLSVGLPVGLSWLVEIWAQVMFPPNIHRRYWYPMDRAALDYELATLKPGSSMIWALTLLLKVHFATIHPPTAVTAKTKYIHASNMMRRA